MNTETIYRYLRRCINGQTLTVNKNDGYYHIVINGNVIDADTLPELQDKIVTWYNDDLSKDYYDTTRITRDINMTGAELTMHNLGYVLASKSCHRGYVSKGRVDMFFSDNYVTIDIYESRNYFKRFIYAKPWKQED